MDVRAVKKIGVERNATQPRDQRAMIDTVVGAMIDTVVGKNLPILGLLYDYVYWEIALITKLRTNETRLPV
jgi:hypothetical protein